MRLRFIYEFLKHPLSTGAVAPSSGRLAREMVAGLGIEDAAVVVEYGPGTGAFTGEIRKRLRRDALFCAIEMNPTMVAAFRERFPETRIFEDSVANVGRILRELGAERVDAVVCGLPWASFGNQLQADLLGATLSVLRDGGRFATFAYLQGLMLPSGRAFRQRLRDSFAVVETSPTVWLNLPPAFVYRCTKGPTVSVR